jgi:DinB superfamily
VSSTLLPVLPVPPILPSGSHRWPEWAIFTPPLKMTGSGEAGAGCGCYISCMTNTSTFTDTATRTPTGHANALAERLEQGARALIAFARGLTADEWKAPMPHDGRPIGVIVHHVASVYPIEIQLASAVGQGQPVTGVTSKDIDAMNAKHAAENASVTKEAAIALLEQNSTAAAAAIRALTDEQLATAMPVSLYEDAPLTCQFVLEDHAVRHSYHHLTLIRKALR